MNWHTFFSFSHRILKNEWLELGMQKTEKIRGDQK